MTIRDLFRAGSIRRENEDLASRLRSVEAERDSLRARLGQAEVMELITLREVTDRTRQEVASAEASAAARRADLAAVEAELDEKRARIVETDERLLLQEFGLYEPKYRLATVAEYKARLDGLRAEQSAMVKNGTACQSATKWELNGSKTEGAKMIRDYTRLIVRAFNTECDGAVEAVKFYNLESSRSRIEKSCDLLNRLGARMSIQITPVYLSSKLNELDLAFEFQIKKQEEKEEQRKLREQAREEAKLQREIDAAREVLAKEERHFRRALASMEDRLSKTTVEADRVLIESEIATIRERIGEVEEQRKDVDFRAQNAQAGYVYVISNIGAFGEGVFKIGVTRRLEPLDRIDELGDASVPFDFDVHVLVFSDNAYGLEAALHRHFGDRRLNMVNGRKEFFRATIEEVEAVLRESFAKPVEVTKIAEAAEYRQSVRMGSPDAPNPGEDSLSILLPQPVEPAV
jgi:hypothetical protein